MKPSKPTKPEANPSLTLPPDWDEAKVKRVLTAYESQTEDEAFAEDEAGVASSETVMNVPHKLVPRVRELIAKRHR